MNGFGAVIPAKAGIQRPNMATPFRKSDMSRVLDSGFRRSDRVGISYAIALGRTLDDCEVIAGCNCLNQDYQNSLDAQDWDDYPENPEIL